MTVPSIIIMYNSTRLITLGVWWLLRALPSNLLFVCITPIFEFNLWHNFDGPITYNARIYFLMVDAGNLTSLVWFGKEKPEGN